MRSDYHLPDPARAPRCAHRPLPATQLLQRNLLVYGVGGLTGAVCWHQADRPAARRNAIFGTRIPPDRRLPLLTTDNRNETPVPNHRSGFLLLTLLTGVLYPLAITGVAQLVFPGGRHMGALSRATARLPAPMLSQRLHGRSPAFGDVLQPPDLTPYNGAASSGFLIRTDRTQP